MISKLYVIGEILKLSNTHVFFGFQNHGGYEKKWIPLRFVEDGDGLEIGVAEIGIDKAYCEKEGIEA